MGHAGHPENGNNAMANPLIEDDEMTLNETQLAAYLAKIGVEGEVSLDLHEPRFPPAS